VGHTPVGFAEAVVEFQIPGDAGPALVVTGHDVSSLATGVAVLDAIDEPWDNSPGLLTHLLNTITLTTLTVRWQASAGPQTLLTRTLNRTPAGSGSAESPQVALLAQKVSGFAGRQNRGRMYVPGLGQDQVDNAGLITSSALVNFAADFAGALSTWSTNNADLVILHTDSAVTPTPVVALEVSPKCATQRRRLR